MEQNRSIKKKKISKCHKFEDLWFLRKDPLQRLRRCYATKEMARKCPKQCKSFQLVVKMIEWHGRIILVINSRSTDEYSGSLDHTRWSARIHAHSCILTRESSSRIWRETAFNRSSITLPICRLAKGPWYTRKSTFLQSNSSSIHRSAFNKIQSAIETFHLVLCVNV